MTDSDAKVTLQRYLQTARDALLWKLDGLSDYDMRRPMTSTGTNLLGLVKHVATVEIGYFGETFGRRYPEELSWFAEDAEENADMWATPDESREYITGLYREACAHSDRSIAELDLDHPAEVPHWAEGRRSTTFGALLVRVVDETVHHAGHADIVRELIDGQGGKDADMLDEAGWSEYYTKIQRAAETRPHG